MDFQVEQIAEHTLCCVLQAQHQDRAVVKPQKGELLQRVPHPRGRRVAHALIDEAFAQFRQRQRAVVQEGVDDLGAQSGCGQQAAIEPDLTVVARGVPEEPRKGQEVVQIDADHFGEDIRRTGTEILDDFLLGAWGPPAPPGLVDRTGQRLQRVAVIEQSLRNEIQCKLKEIGFQGCGVVIARLSGPRQHACVDPVVFLIHPEHTPRKV